MKKGFTILELLVASLLLGMLVSIMTMIFNQSAIAWRTGTAGVSDLDDIRENMAVLREEADNAFVWNKKLQMITGLWDDDGNLRKRACDAEEGSKSQILRSKTGLFGDDAKPWSSDNLHSVGNKGKDKKIVTYTVNVKSAGPNREFGDYDDIWSWPDDFE